MKPHILVTFFFLLMFFLVAGICAESGIDAACPGMAVSSAVDPRQHLMGERAMVTSTLISAEWASVRAAMGRQTGLPS